MAAEIKYLIDGFERILIREGLADIHDVDKLSEAQGQLAAMTAELYWKGQIPKVEALQLIQRLATRVYEAVLEREKIDMKLRAKQANIECLTTDTHGSKTAKMLAKTGIPWGTGEASRGLAVAVIHSDIGIAGSHKNAVTIADYLSFCELVLDDSQLGNEIPSEQIPKTMSSPDGLITIAHEAASEALDEFSLISPDGSIPKSGSVIMLAGLDFLQPDQFPLIIDAVENTVRTHPVTINCRLETQGRINVGYALGQYAGIIYGGKTHPDPNFSSPNFYSLRST